MLNLIGEHFPLLAAAVMVIFVAILLPTSLIDNLSSNDPK